MDRRKKAVAILNPRAAGGRTAKRWPGIAALLQQRLGVVEERRTEHAGHATELARQALRGGCELVISIGGDGTLNEVVNGFLDGDGRPINPEAQLGLIPIGTGGDFQRTVEIPSDEARAVDILVCGKALSLDLGKARFSGHDGAPITRYFINLLSFGMGGDVSVRAKNFLSPISGKLAFFYATFVVFFSYRGKTVRLTLDGAPQPAPFTITNIAVGNGRYHGGGMHPCPRAVLDDGLLEVTTIDRLNMFELVRDIKTLYSDDVYKHPKVRHFRARQIAAESDETTRIEVDGESLGRLPLEVEILPKRVPFLVDAASPLLG